MSTFFERNKKKTALAALLLFIRQRKALSALLLLVALASFLFVSPSYSLIDLPGGSRLAAGVAWIAGKLGLGRDKRSFDELMAAFKAAKEGNGRAGWGSFFGSGGAGPDSLGLVAGRRSDLESGASAEDKLGRKGSVAGIVNPDDKRNQADGVSLSDADLAGEREGLVKNAFAGGFGPGFGRGGLGRGDGVLGASLSGGAYAGKGFFGGKRGAAGSNGREDYEKAIREASVPATSGRFVKNGVPGRMSSSVAKKIGASIEQGMKNLNILPSDPNSGIKQLGQARGCSSLAVTANCRPGECPGEAAASASGAVYVGAQDCGIEGDLVTAPQIDGLQSPNMPDTGMVDDYIAQAEQLEKDAKLCKELDAKYGPTETAKQAQLESISRQFDAMGCGQGGCSKSKAKRCQALGDRMKQVCREYMNVRCQHTRECPLTKNNNCSPSECNGAARNKSKVVDQNDGVRTETQD
jgi:hypothetical protein